jgi:large subunit ribosomal protein L3
MSKGIIGRKVGMTQVYLEDGTAKPVTVLEAGPCHVLQIRTEDRDGYSAMQVGYGDKPRRLASRSETGHVANIASKRSKAAAAAGVEALKKPDCEPKRVVKEFPLTEGIEVGAEIALDIFSDVKAVDVTGTSKGRGFAGVMKRHGFKGQRATHGVKKVHRHAGGTGMGTYPGRTNRGKKMPGHFGNVQKTTRNLKVVRVDAEKNLLLVQGAVPGPNGGYVIIRETNKLG